MVRARLPWEASYQDGVSWDAVLDIKPVGEYLSEAAQRWPTTTALIFGDERYTYSELWESAERAARAFAGLGVERGVNVGVLFPNCPRHAIMCFGVLIAGGTVVNLSADASWRNLEDQLAQTGAAILVTSGDILVTRKIRDVVEATQVRTVVVFGREADAEPFPESVVKLDSELFMAQAIDQAIDHRPVDLDQVALLQFTGGTTGAPKGATLRHRNVSSAIEIVRYWLGPLFTEPHRGCAVVLPMSHIFGLTTFLSCIGSGTPIFCTGRSIRS